MLLEPYQYQCQVTGVVKAYKKMTLQKAKTYNGVLADQGARGRWLPQLEVVVAQAQREGAHEPLKA